MYNLIRKYFFMAAGIIPMAYFLFFYRFSFNFEVEENGHYWLVLFFSFVQILRTAFLTGWNGPSQRNILDCLFSLAILAMYLLTGPGNESAIVCLSLVIGLVLFLQMDIQRLICLLYSFLPFLVIEVVLAIIQSCQGQPVRGTLQNTGIFSIYLSVHIPLVFYGIFKNKEVKKCLGNFFPGSLFALYLFFLLYTILKEHSRTALISTILVSALLMREDLLPRIRGKTMRFSRRIWFAALPVALILFTSLTFYLYSLKKLSAQGRFLMNNIAFRHITDHFWFGTGIGRYTWYYPQWQSDYFRDASAHPPNFYLSAGESYIIFNEYLQLFETVGVLGFLVCLLILISFFKTQSSGHQGLLRMIKLTLTGILACSFTSYPLHVNVLFLLFLVCLAIAFKMNGETMWDRFSVASQDLMIRRRLRIRRSIQARRSLRIQQVLLVIALGSSTILLALAFRQSTAVWKWQRLRGDNELSYPEKKAGFVQLYPILKNDGKFLTDYGAFLTDSPGDADQAVKILEEARHHFFSRQTIEALGYAYWRSNDLPNAVACFEWVNNYLPNLFGPKLTLMKLYIETGDMDKMKAMGHMIIRTPPKIPSEEVNAIKFQAERLLERGFSQH